ncbi:MAG: hypothetical protein ACRC41_03835 [Sarcina sp.]
MKNTKISVIVLGVVIIGAVATTIGYKASIQKNVVQKSEIKNKSDVKSNDGQSGVQGEVESKEKETDENIEYEKNNSNEKQTSVNTNEESKEKKESSNFEAKLNSYVTEFREGKSDVPEFMSNLRSIDTKNLSNDEKLQLDNVNKAASEWSDLNSFYSQVRMAGDGSMQDIVKYSGANELALAKEISKIDTKNIIDTGIVSRENVDKRTTFLEEYIKAQEENLNKQNSN